MEDYLSDTLVVGTQQTIRIRFRDKTLNAAGQITRTAVDLTGKTTKIHWSIDGAAQVTKDMTNDPDQVNNTGEATYEFTDVDLSGVTSSAEMRIVGEIVDGSDNHYTIDYAAVTVKTLANMLGIAA